jgi:hypothetical protein
MSASNGASFRNTSLGGLCPFATQIHGVVSQNAGNSGRVGFCDHTAGGFMATMKNPTFWNSRQVSTHFAVGRDGEIIQMVNIFDTAWAQGRLGPTVIWPPYLQMVAGTGTKNPNAWLISTEHEDKNGDPFWTPEQYDATLRLKRWCVAECAAAGFDALGFGRDSLAGHYMFDQVNRPGCPGVHWRNEYRDRLWADLSVSPPPEDDMSDQEKIDLAVLTQTQRVIRALSTPAAGRIPRLHAVARSDGLPGVELKWIDPSGQGRSFTPPYWIPGALL